MKIKNLFNRDAWDTRITLLFKDFFVKNFIKTYYYSRTVYNSSWLGVTTLKAPTDLWIYQELIVQLKPDFIIECGTFNGGSALYLASVCDLVNKGHVITIDINPCTTTHPRITKIVDSEGSTSIQVLNKVKEMVGSDSCFVILDSTHRKDHVLKEMEYYSPFVPIGGYMIVEDTSLGGNPILHSWGNGPMDAVKEFIKKGTFFIDKSQEKFLLTLHPSGFLKRIK